MNNDELKYHLKELIIGQLNLQDMTPDDIRNDAPLFLEGLGLDSIDALELVVIMEKHFGVRIPDEAAGRKALYSIDTMADYITEARTKAK